MKSKLTLLLWFLIPNLLTSQEIGIIENQATLFKLPMDNDFVEFIIVDNNIDKGKKKPIFLWCQGSLPLPLFGEVENENIFFFGGGIANFDYKKIVNDYHLVVISMPKTPVLVKRENLNKQFQYIPDKSKPNSLSMDFLQADYLENYVQRGNLVIDFLTQQKWVDPTKLIIAGHSQGTKVATKLAQSNPISHLGLFAPNPFGRIDQSIRQARLEAQMGKITWEEADVLINQKYEFYQSAQDTSLYPTNPTLKSWKSFSEPFYDDWLQLNIPIYLAYGTEDRVSDLCDIVPIFFIDAKKNHLTLKRHLHLEHNFFEVLENGKIDYNSNHWNKVMDNFLDWINQPSN